MALEFLKRKSVTFCCWQISMVHWHQQLLTTW
jgi:hypothetical protein